MPDTRQLAALLRLHDDDSDSVRATVLAELAAFGEGLAEALRELPDAPDEATIEQVLEAVSRHGQPEPESRPARRPVLYEAGQLVRHKRYGYRGVVVSRDASCRASDGWYERNRTQPERDQPWYHVLVHGKTEVTYAAQTSLIPDESMAAVRHPLVPFFFNGQKDGAYIRNDRRWPPDQAMDDQGDAQGDDQGDDQAMDHDSDGGGSRDPGSDP